ncbi:hypothetical protein B0H19DRAFT_1157484 [Mycena capillaripes]|nr:hypothetical protein B0H19DRAFT_1157484 [Mycena capillaripes]
MRLNVIVDGMNTDAFFCEAFATAFPHVTHLIVVCEIQVAPSMPVPLCEMLCLLPALQVLHIYGIYGTVVDAPATVVSPQGLHDLELCEASAQPILAWLPAVGHLPNVDSVMLPLLQRRAVPTICAALQQLGAALHHLNLSLNGDTWTMVDLAAPQPQITGHSRRLLGLQLRTLGIRSNHASDKDARGPALERLVSSSICPRTGT